MGADFIATGHYAQIEKGILLESKDKNKDQSYFFYTLTQNELNTYFFQLDIYKKRKSGNLPQNINYQPLRKKTAKGFVLSAKLI
jgi:tRNA-specific 2-thiouridylase